MQLYRNMTAMQTLRKVYCKKPDEDKNELQTPLFINIYNCNNKTGIVCIAGSAK